jgi:heme/copper-type cytochrome/quinol oxidase subunit 2
MPASPQNAIRKLFLGGIMTIVILIVVFVLLLVALMWTRGRRRA